MNVLVAFLDLFKKALYPMDNFRSTYVAADIHPGLTASTAADQHV